MCPRFRPHLTRRLILSPLRKGRLLGNPRGQVARPLLPLNSRRELLSRPGQAHSQLGRTVAHPSDPPRSVVRGLGLESKNCRRDHSALFEQGEPARCSTVSIFTSKFRPSRTGNRAARIPGRHAHSSGKRPHHRRSRFRWESVTAKHLAEAVQYRSPDRSYCRTAYSWRADPRVSTDISYFRAPIRIP